MLWALGRGGASCRHWFSPLQYTPVTQDNRVSPPYRHWYVPFKCTPLCAGQWMAFTWFSIPMPSLHSPSTLAVPVQRSVPRIVTYGNLCVRHSYTVSHAGASLAATHLTSYGAPPTSWPGGIAPTFWCRVAMCIPINTFTASSSSFASHPLKSCAPEGEPPPVTYAVSLTCHCSTAA